jgi:hypothetical protein
MRVDAHELTLAGDVRGSAPAGRRPAQGGPHRPVPQSWWLNIDLYALLNREWQLL